MLLGLPSVMEGRGLRDLWTCGSEAAEFFDILTHDDRGSYYVVARSCGGEWIQSSVKSELLGLISLENDGSSYYVTHNGFNGKKREANRCRQINSLMFDIDCHDGSYREVLPELIQCLESSFATGGLPRPNLFVETGRGVQLYYVLARSTPYRVRGGRLNEKGIEFFRDIEAGLSLSISKAIAGISQAKLDTCVYDLSRVGRIPGSFNQNSKTRCTLRASSRDYYSLADLKVFCEMAAVKRSKARIARGKPTKYDAMLTSRIKMLERLQEHRGFSCLGSRENMCFVFYNTATQVYGPDKAYEMALDFNRRFVSPLPDSDIAQIKRTVDNVVVAFGVHKGDKGYYPLKTETIVSMLGISNSEINAVGVYSPGRKAQREAAKRRTREKRETRDARICALYDRGYSQSEIAKKVGCSPRTVFTVLKRENVTRGNLLQSIKEQFKAVLVARKEEFAKSCQTSWVVKGFKKRSDGTAGTELGLGLFEDCGSFGFFLPFLS